MANFDIPEIQDYLRNQNIDGWLIFDFRGQNYIANSMFKMGESILTRRWFYFIPTAGEPSLLVHKIERNNFPEPPPQTDYYVSWRELHDKLAAMVGVASKVAMEYSPNCAIPYVSCVDAGTLEFVRALGVEVVSSANLVQYFQGRWSDEQLQSHIRASENVHRIKDQAFALVGEKIKSGQAISEFDVQRFIYEQLDACQMMTEEPPIVAVNANASNPHYAPTSDRFSAIQEGDLLLIDLFGKEKLLDAVYADITWMGFVGETPRDEHRKVFEVVANGRDAGLSLIKARSNANGALQGWEIDTEVRKVITDAGYGDYFDHRTGHSLDTKIHGNSVHIDSLETQDEREVIPGIGFTIEPGVYLPEFGIRSEINVFYSKEGPKVYGPIQKEIIPILK